LVIRENGRVIIAQRHLERRGSFPMRMLFNCSWMNCWSFEIQILMLASAVLPDKT
jgi:hypothetical protein